MAALEGCSYKVHEGVLANGSNNQLYFSSDALDETPGAVGVVRTMTVARFGATDIQCHGIGTRSASAAGHVAIQGGSLPSDTCSGRPADPVTFVSAACDGDACAVTNDMAGDRIALHVTGKTAGATRLLVSVKAADGTVYDDWIPVTFAVASRIRLSVGANELGAMKQPVLPGFAITMPRAQVVDASNRALVFDDGLLLGTVEGSAFEPPDATGMASSSLVAKRAGHTTLRWSLAALLERTIDLEVVDVAEARAVLVYAPPSTSSGSTSDSASLDIDPDDATVDPMTTGGRTTSLQVGAGSYLTKTYPVRVSLSDGRIAIAPVASVEVVPAALVLAMQSMESVAAIDLYNGVVGTGSATIRIDGGPSLTLPVTVTER